MSEEPLPPTDSPRLEEASRDWFTTNLHWVALATVLIVALGLAGAWWLNRQEETRTASLKSSYAATTSAEWEAVIQQYPGTPGALMAALRAAEDAKREGRFGDAAAFYRQIGTLSPDSTFARLARYAEGGCLEAAGELDQARRVYEDIHRQRPDHPYLGGAVMGLARIEAAAGQIAAAREILADYLATHTQTPGQPMDPFVAGCEELLNSLPRPEVQASPAAQEDEASPAR